MPRCLRPGELLRLHLSGDADIPEATRPTFLTPGLSADKWRQMMGQFLKLAKQQREQAVTADTISGMEMSADALTACFDLLGTSIVGWEHMIDQRANPPKELAFSPEALQNVLDPVEAMELMQLVLNAANVSKEDKKKLGSRVTSAPGKSAKTARRTASTHQQNGSR